MLEHLGQPKLPSPASHANSLSALASFLKERQIEPTEIIGAVLRDDFFKERDIQLEALRAAGWPKAYVKTRKWLIEHWYRLMRLLDHDGAKYDGTPTPIQAVFRSLMRGRSYHAVARDCGIKPDTLAGWCNGIVPKPGKSDIKLKRIEVYFDVPRGTITDLLPYNAGHATATAGGPFIPFREKMSRLTKDRYMLKERDVPPEARNQWMGLATYKVAVLKIREACSSAVSDPLERYKAAKARGAVTAETSRKRWKIEPLDRSEVVPPDRWVDIVHGQLCTSSKSNFIHASSYWGWATLSKERDGLELPHEDISLQLFCDTDRLGRYLEWRIKRSENINSGLTNFLKFVCMLTHPETGFLLRLADSLGVDPADWSEHCMNTYSWANAERLTIDAAGVELSRDPRDPIRQVLKRRKPLGAITEAIRRMDLDTPWDNNKIAHARNTLLLALASSNCLRAKQLSGLTYYSDNSGKVYQTSDGEWRIRIPKREFKNYEGAAKHEDYNQAINAAVWPYIRRWLKEFRPLVVGSRPELFFVSQRDGDRPWSPKELSRAFSEVTRKYVSGTNGFGIHNMRHIVATHIILNGDGLNAPGTPGAVITAAGALHDMPATVSNYYRLILETAGDIARERATGIDLADMAPRPVRMSRQPSDAVA